MITNYELWIVNQNYSYGVINQELLFSIGRSRFINQRLWITNDRSLNSFQEISIWICLSWIINQHLRIKSYQSGIIDQKLAIIIYQWRVLNQDLAIWHYELGIINQELNPCTNLWGWPTYHTSYLCPFVIAYRYGPGGMRGAFEYIYIYDSVCLQQ